MSIETTHGGARQRRVRHAVIWLLLLGLIGVLSRPPEPVHAEIRWLQFTPSATPKSNAISVDPSHEKNH